MIYRLEETSLDYNISFFKSITTNTNSKILIFGDIPEPFIKVFEVIKKTYTVHEFIDNVELPILEQAEVIVIFDRLFNVNLLDNFKSIDSLPKIVLFHTKAESPVFVTVQKGGTNLVVNFVKALGYTPFGDGVKESYARTHETLKKHKKTRRDGSIPFNFLVEKFGTDNTALFTHGMKLEPDTTVRDLGGDITISEGATNDPTGALWTWINKKTPPIVFFYRDPRDVLVSLIHYLLGNYSTNYWLSTTSQILRSLPTMQERIDYIIKCVPRFLDIAFRQHLWLLHHPNVCKVSFENLIGTKGGGNEFDQLIAVSKMMIHLSIHGDVKSIAKSLYSTKARTFRKGKIGDWQNHFSEKNIKNFTEKYNDILELYGY